MNLPNKLTMFRMFLIPVMVIIYLLRTYIGDATLSIIGVIFVLASITDLLDGQIARKRNLVTTFGKFMDPLADKLLVISVLFILNNIYLVYYPNTLTMWMPFWVVWIILMREFLVTSIRLIAISNGKVIAASSWGKYKTACTMMTIVYYLFVMPMNLTVVNYIGIVLVGISVLLTVISGVDYYLKNKEVVKISI